MLFQILVYMQNTPCIVGNKCISHVPFVVQTDSQMNGWKKCTPDSPSSACVFLGCIYATFVLRLYLYGVFIQGKCAETGLFMERELVHAVAVDRSHWTREPGVFHMDWWLYTHFGVKRWNPHSAQSVHGGLLWRLQEAQAIPRYVGGSSSNDWASSPQSADYIANFIGNFSFGFGVHFWVLYI